MWTRSTKPRDLFWFFGLVGPPSSPAPRRPSGFSGSYVMAHSRHHSPVLAYTGCSTIHDHLLSPTGPSILLQFCLLFAVHRRSFFALNTVSRLEPTAKYRIVRIMLLNLSHDAGIKERGSGPFGLVMALNRWPELRFVSGFSKDSRFQTGF